MAFFKNMAFVLSVACASTVALGHGKHPHVDDNDGIDITHLTCVGLCCSKEKQNPKELLQLALYAINEGFTKPKKELLECIQVCDDLYGENSFHDIQQSFNYLSKHALKTVYKFATSINFNIKDPWHTYLKIAGAHKNKEALREGISEIKDAMKEDLAKAKSELSEGAAEVSGAIQENVTATAEQVKDTLSNTTEEVGDELSKASDALESTGAQVSETISDMTKEAQTGVENVTGMAEDGVKRLKDLRNSPFKSKKDGTQGEG